VSAIEIIALLLALLGVLAGAWAALRADAQAAGAGVVLVGIALLLQLIGK
jgi:hypothetical protein